MADCGASGSTLDRAFSSFITANQGNRITSDALERATKAVSSMVGEIALNAMPSKIGTTKASIQLTGPAETLIQCTDKINTASFSSNHQVYPVWHHHQQATTAQYTFATHSPYSMHHHNNNYDLQNRFNILNNMNAINMAYPSHARFVNNTTQSNYPLHSQQIESESKEIFQENMNGSAHDVTMEEIAAAWEEAEREYLSYQENDLSDLAHPYTDERNFGILSNTMFPYDFSMESRHYGTSHIDPDSISDHHQTVEPNPRLNLMEKGVELFQQGEIPEAILCFESHLLTVNPDDADAWLLLGKCHAENDEDRKAIACLERSVERNPKSSAALLALGVSCVNEFLHERALVHLKNWITHHPQYANLAHSSESQRLNGSSEALALDELKQLLKLALDMDESSDVPHSAEVLEAMGIVCNVSREYDDAANYFRAAIHYRTDDYQLWNKLGATLANSNHSDEALHAYRQALSIKPKYARAWLNLAIAHSNLQNHDEAARCYLQTLSLNPLATHVWNYLRISVTALERWDLMPLISSRDVQQFHSYFDFVEF